MFQGFFFFLQRNWSFSLNDGESPPVSRLRNTKTGSKREPCDSPHVEVWGTRHRPSPSATLPHPPWPFNFKLLLPTGPKGKQLAMHAMPLAFPTTVVWLPGSAGVSGNQCACRWAGTWRSRKLLNGEDPGNQIPHSDEAWLSSLRYVTLFLLDELEFGLNYEFVHPTNSE